MESGGLRTVAFVVTGPCPLVLLSKVAALKQFKAAIDRRRARSDRPVEAGELVLIHVVYT